MTMPDVKAYAAPERAGASGLPRARRLRNGAALERRLDRRRGAQHPRGLLLGPADRTQALHLFLEASRFSFADRNAYLADPAFFDVPLAGLLSDGFAAERRARSTPAGCGQPRAAGRPLSLRHGGPSFVTALQSETTTHLTVADRFGNVVSYTFTIESTGGNGIVVPGWGFLLNNELTDFNFDSLTHPNRVEGGKRPRAR